MATGHSSPFDRSSKKHGRRDPFDRIPAARHDASSDQEASFGRVLKSALFALPFAALCGLALLSVMAALAMAQADPNAVITPFSLVVLGLCSIVGGFIGSRRCGHSHVLCGLLFGLLFSLLIWMLSLLFGDRTGNVLSMQLASPLSWLLRAAVVGLSLLGGVLGARRPARTTHHTLK